jgi:hypothetical protein
MKSLTIDCTNPLPAITADRTPPLVVTQATSPPRQSSPSDASTAGTLRSQTPLECDYDVRPTLLYKCIQSRAWSRVIHLLSEANNSHAARVWVVRKEPNARLRWRLLPLHAALIFQAPHFVVEALLEAYPQAASQKDDQGMLPLHLALRNRPVPWQAVELLLEAYPAAVYAQDRKGRTPLQGAAAVVSTSNKTTRLCGTDSIATAATTALADGSCTPLDQETNNAAAFSVLQLYTQIAVAGAQQQLIEQQQSMTTPTQQQQQTTSTTIQSLEALHAANLERLEALYADELNKWKTATDATKRDYETKLEQGVHRERALLEEIQRLNQLRIVAQETNNKSPTNSRQTTTTNTASIRVSSPTISDLRILELEQENQCFQESIEELLEQHDLLLTSFQELSGEQSTRYNQHCDYLKQASESLQESKAHQTARLDALQSQLQVASARARERLQHIGWTERSPSSSTTDTTANDIRDAQQLSSRLEHVEIDQETTTDDEHAQRSSSVVVVVRVPKPDRTSVVSQPTTTVGVASKHALENNNMSSASNELHANADAPPAVVPRTMEANSNQESRHETKSAKNQDPLKQVSPNGCALACLLR